MLRLLRVLIFAFLFIPAVSLAQAPEASGKVRVVTTIFPLYDFARAVGGEYTDVSLLLPPGVEPHAFEPTTGDIERINEADIFIYMGSVMEPWVQKLLPGITNQNLQIIDASLGVSLYQHPVPEDSGEVKKHGPVDPHIWLDFIDDMQIVDTVADALATRDPEHKSDYEDNASAYKARLSDLDHQYSAGLSGCSTRTVIFAGHSAFGYLARRYNLEFLSPYAGYSPDAEPTPMAVAGIITLMKEKGARTVFYEELIDPRIARTIADEIGGKTVLLDAAHNISADELQAGATFLSIMTDDLKKLREALSCP
jgi:zinc transport system substrate-binding protein